MNVDDSSLVLADDVGRNEPEVAGQHDEVDLVRLDQLAERCLLWPLVRRENYGFNLGARRALEGAGVRSITRDEHDVSTATISKPVEMLQNGLKIRSATRREDCDARSHRADIIAGPRWPEARRRIDRLPRPAIQRSLRRPARLDRDLRAASYRGRSDIALPRVCRPAPNRATDRR